jgi:hypothetical protein
MRKVLFRSPFKPFSDVVHHRHRCSLNLAAKIEITTLFQRAVNGVRQAACFLPDLEVFKSFRELHALLFTRDSLPVSPFGPSKAVYHAIFRATGFHLVVDPGVGLFHAFAEGNGGFPAEELFDEGIVAAAAADALGSVEFVFALQ